MAKQSQNIYALELTGIFVSALASMLLIVVSVWGISTYIVDSNDETNAVLGGTETLASDVQRLSYLENLALGTGQVAGVVDDSSVSENKFRNSAADWFTEARKLQGMDTAYRDGVLDRNAQNHARLVVQACDESIYSDWSETINTRIDEGLVSSFTEAVFPVTSALRISSELPLAEVDYSRLFTGFAAYGIGVAEVPIDSGCGLSHVIVFHLAEVK